MSETQARPAVRIETYPSDALRGVPPFDFAVPRGWVVFEAPDSHALIRTPVQVADFWVNAVIQSDRVPRKIELPHAAVLTMRQIEAAGSEIRIDEEKIGSFGDRQTYLRTIEVTPNDSTQRVAQLHALFFAPTPDDKALHDLFQIVGSCPVEVAETFMPIFVRMVASFRFT